MSLSELSQLHQRIAACQKCTELSNHIKFPPECHGTTRYGIMLVSEGAYLPSIQAGRYFTRGNLRDAIPNLEDFCYLTDVIKCDSSCGKSENLAKMCFPYLAEEIAIIKPCAILAVGALPFKMLTEITGGFSGRHGQRKKYFYNASLK